MKTLFFSASAWSHDRTREPLNKFNKPYYTYFDWKFKLGKICHFLIWGSICQFLTGFKQTIPGECWRCAKFLASSLNGLVQIFVESAKEVIAIDAIGQLNSGYQWKGLVQMAYRLLRTFTIYIWIIADALWKALLIQSAWRNQNSITYQMNITLHIPPLILSELVAEEPELPQEIIF